MQTYNSNYYNPYILDNNYLDDIINFSTIRSNDYNNYNLKQKKSLDNNLTSLPKEWDNVPDNQPIVYQDAQGNITNIHKKNGEYYIGDNKLDKQGNYYSGYSLNSIKTGVGNFLSDKENRRNLAFDTLGIVGAFSNRHYLRNAIRDQQRRKPDGYTNVGYNDDYLGFAESNYGESGLDLTTDNNQEDDSYGQWNYYQPQEELPDVYEEDHDVYRHDDFWNEPFSLDGESSQYYSEKDTDTEDELGYIDNTDDIEDNNALPAFLTNYRTNKSSIKQEAYNYLEHKGLPSHVIHGILANLEAESNFNINAIGDRGKARGLAQWHPDRYNALKNAGLNLKTFTGQLDAVLHELNTSKNHVYKKLLKSNSPEEATDIFMKEYEIPKNRTTGLRYKYLR